MHICERCTEHRIVYTAIVTEEECECYCHKEIESGCVCDPCCR